MKLCKIPWAATIHHIWLQGNTRIHNGNFKIGGIFHPLKLMLEGGLFLLKRRRNCISFNQSYILKQESKTIKKLVGNYHAIQSTFFEQSNFQYHLN